MTPDQIKGLTDFMGKVAQYAPHFKGPEPVDQAAKTNIAVWEKVSIEDGYGGAFVSQFGNQQWL